MASSAGSECSRDPINPRIKRYSTDWGASSWIEKQIEVVKEIRSYFHEERFALSTISSRPFI